MKRIKLLVNAVLSLSLSLGTTPVFARQHDDEKAANERISSSHEIAKADGQALARQNFGMTINRMIGGLEAYGKSRELADVYRNSLVEIEDQFKALQVDDPNKLDLTRADLEAFVERYQKAVRDRFVSSWIPSVQAEEFQAARGLITSLVADAQNVCRMGQADLRNSYLTNVMRPPGFVTRVNVDVVPNIAGILTLSSPVLLNVGYGSATGGSAAANRDRNHLTSGVLAVTNVANTFFISAKSYAIVNSMFASSTATAGATTATAATSGAAATAGAVANAIVTAAPYMAAVALAVVIAVDITARAEALRVAKRFEKSRKRVQDEGADHEAVNKAYRESCGQLTKAVEAVGTTLDELEGPARSARLTAAHALEPDLVAWGEDSQRHELVACQIDLHLKYAHSQCGDLPVDWKPELHHMSHDDFKSVCGVPPLKDRISYLDGSCAIPFAENAREAHFKELKAADEDFRKKYPTERIGELLGAKLALTFENQEQLQSQMRSASLAQIEDLQNRAFALGYTYLNIVHRANATSSVRDEFAIEIKARMQIDQIRTRFIELAHRAVKVTSGLESKAQLRQDVTALRKSFAPLGLRYDHVKSVHDLGRAIDLTYDDMRHWR